MIFLAVSQKSSFAFDRQQIINYARYYPDPNCCAKINTNNFGVPPRVFASPSLPPPGSQQVTQAINQIEILKSQMKNLW